MKFNGFWEHTPVLLCKTRGEGSMHVIYKKLPMHEPSFAFAKLVLCIH